MKLVFMEGVADTFISLPTPTPSLPLSANYSSRTPEHAAVLPTGHCSPCCSHNDVTGVWFRCAGGGRLHSLPHLRFLPDVHLCSPHPLTGTASLLGAINARSLSRPPTSHTARTRLVPAPRSTQQPFTRAFWLRYSTMDKLSFRAWVRFTACSLARHALWVLAFSLPATFSAILVYL